MSNFIIDGDGDLAVKVTDTGAREVATFLVSRKALTVASTVLRAMLGKDSPFMESASTVGPGIATVNFRDDAIHAVNTWFLIIHSKNDSVRHAIEPTKLYEIALLCDKYNLTESLGLWTEQWMRAPAPVIARIGALRTIYIACVFRDRRVLIKATRSRIVYTSVSRDKIVNDRSRGVEYEEEGDVPIPPDLTGKFLVIVDATRRPYCLSS